MFCVRLRDSLSNRSGPLFRLFEALDGLGGLEKLQVSEGAARAELVAQTGAKDPSVVRLAVKENRKLSPDEVAALVRQYKAEATLRSLSVSFRLHTQTVRAHLRREGVDLRPVRTLEGVLADEAVRLYVEDQLSLIRVGRRLGVSADAVRRVLMQRGVQRRSKTVRGQRE